MHPSGRKTSRTQDEYIAMYRQQSPASVNRDRRNVFNGKHNTYHFVKGKQNLHRVGHLDLLNRALLFVAQGRVEPGTINAESVSRL